MYGRAVAPSVPRPHRELLAHERVHLAPGAAASLSFAVPLTALGHWDVAHGRWTVEPGPYEIHAGASVGDIRRTVRVEVAGEAPGPRPVLGDGLAAVDYDEQSGTVIVDRTKAAGEAVTSADPCTEAEADTVGMLVYHSCDFGDGVTEVTVTVAGETGGKVVLGTAHGTGPDRVAGVSGIARIEVPATGGPYVYRTVRAPLVAREVADLRVELRGDLRLAHIGFHA